MGCTMVVETNVFLLAEEDANCARVWHRACYSWDDMLAVDSSHAIISEYKEYAQKYPE